MSTTLKLNKPSDLNEWAYNIIKSRILNNEIIPETQLKVDELSSELNISRTPIREALLRLVSDNLVNVRSRVGFFVRGITRKEISDLLELRRIIESYAAMVAAENFKPEQIKELFSLHDKAVMAVKNNDYSGFNKNEIAMHSLLIDNLNNQAIRNAMNNVGDCLYRERIYALHYKDNVEKSIKEHELVLNAIAEKDPIAARNFMEKHISAIESRLINAIEFQD
jgi:DNA-binding GntR family transcriptional regulator